MNVASSCSCVHGVGLGFVIFTQVALAYGLAAAVGSLRVLPHDLGLLGWLPVQLAIWALTAFSHAAVVTSDAGKCGTAVDHLEAAGPHCRVCRRTKPEGAHHCSTCGVCIMHMDHHCVWIANCVGKRNQKLFLLFLLYTLGACQACLYGLLPPALRCKSQLEDLAAARLPPVLRAAFVLLFAVPPDALVRGDRASLIRPSDLGMRPLLSNLSPPTGNHLGSSEEEHCLRCLLPLAITIVLSGAFSLLLLFMGVRQVIYLRTSATYIERLRHGKDFQPLPASSGSWREAWRRLEGVCGEPLSWRWLVPRIGAAHTGGRKAS